MKPLSLALVLLLALGYAGNADSASILFFQGISSYSQRIMLWRLAEGLADRNHSVTFLSPHAPRSGTHPNPRITEISPKPAQDLVDNLFGLGAKPIEVRIANQYRDIWYDLPELVAPYCDLLLRSPEIQTWVNSTNATFDLVIIDTLFGECGLGLAWKFRAPHIDFSTTPLPMWQYDVYGVPAETSSIPDMQFHSPLEMTLWTRTENTLRVIYWYFMRFQDAFPALEKSLRELLHIPDMPSIAELERDPSLVLINSHFRVDHAKALPPLFVPISGIHCRETNNLSPLPEVTPYYAKNDVIVLASRTQTKNSQNTI